MGKTVAMIGGAMYAQYRVIKARDVLPLPDGTRRPKAPHASSIADGAWHDRDHAARGSQGAGAHGRRLQPRPDAQQDLHQGRHRSRQHRAQQEQADILHKLGAKYVVDSTAPSFMDDLTSALVETGADDRLRCDRRWQARGQILTCMEIAANKTAKVYSRYGSSVHKQVYVYGGLDPRRSN